MAAPADRMAARLPAAVPVEPLGADRCVVTVGADNPRMLAAYLAMLDADFQVDPNAPHRSWPPL